MNLDGPFTVYDKRTGVVATDPVTKTSFTTYTASPGVHYMCDLATFTAKQALLAPYRVTPTTPLQRVWAGDNPANPQWTVALVFPDQATANSVLAQVLPPAVP